MSAGTLVLDCWGIEDLAIATKGRCSHPAFVGIYVGSFNLRASGSIMCVWHGMPVCVTHTEKETDEERINKHVCMVPSSYSLYIPVHLRIYWPP